LQDTVYIQQDAHPYQTPGGFDPLQLSRFPFVKSAVVAFTGNTHGTTTVDGITSTAGLVVGSLIFAADGSIPAGTTIATVLANSITLSAAATTTVTGQSFTTGMQVIQTLAVGQPQLLVYGQDYTIDALRGWLIRLNVWTGASATWESAPLTVQYQAGFSTIPADLNDACLRLVTSRFKSRGRDPMLVERSQPQTLGTERYWVGTTPGQKGAFPPEITGLIDQYRVPVTG
jgi:hypothetical protein